MAWTVRDALITALEELPKSSFKMLKYKLNDSEIREGYMKIPRGRLEGADREDVVDLIRSYYKDDYGAELTLAVLNAIGENQVAQDLRKDLANVAKPEPGTLEVDSSRQQEDCVDNTRSPPSYLTERLTCCICTDIFTDPVTLPCGHSFCMDCVRRHWANQHEREASCPLCAKIYMRKPELIKSHLLCNLVEEYRLQHTDGATNYV